MKFSQVMALDDSEPIPDSWLQGRTLFGGLQAALAVRAMRRLVPAELPLRSLQTSFIAPVGAGVLRIETQVLRTGKSAIQVEARLLDGKQTACLLLGIFGRARQSVISIEPPLPKVARELAASRELSYRPGMSPVFTQQLQFRWALNLPYSKAAEAKTQIYVRLQDEVPVTELQLLALADAIPTPALSLLPPQPVMASSLTWTLEILREDYERDAAAFWLMDAEVTAARDGYLNQTATLWSPDGKAVALSRQSVVAFV